MRYLQKAITQLDYEQFQMVREALHERANLLKIAPHLSAPLPIMLPIYKCVSRGASCDRGGGRLSGVHAVPSDRTVALPPRLCAAHRWWLLPYYWFGIKMYDLVAGTKVRA